MRIVESSSSTQKIVGVAVSLLAAANLSLQAEELPSGSRPEGVAQSPALSQSPQNAQAAVFADPALEKRRAELRLEMEGMMRRVLADEQRGPERAVESKAPTPKTVVTSEAAPPAELPKAKLTVSALVGSSALNAFAFVLVRALASIGVTSRRSSWELEGFSSGVKKEPSIKSLLVSESFDGHTLPGGRAAWNSFVALNMRLFGVSGCALLGAFLLTKPLGIPPVVLSPFTLVAVLASAHGGGRLWAKMSSWLSGLPVQTCSDREANCATAFFGSITLGLLSSTVIGAGLFSNLTFFACSVLGTACSLPLLRLGLIQMRRIEADLANARSKS